MNLITREEGREYLGFEGKPPELEEVESEEVETDTEDQTKPEQDEKEKIQTKAKNNKKVKEPKNRDGRMPKGD